MNNEDLVAISIGQGDLHMTMRVQRAVLDKMNEIAARYPEGYWGDKGFDLMEMAEAEMDEEEKK